MGFNHQKYVDIINMGLIPSIFWDLTTINVAFSKIFPVVFFFWPSQTRLHGEHAVDLGTDGSAATGAGTRGAPHPWHPWQNLSGKA